MVKTVAAYMKNPKGKEKRRKKLEEQEVDRRRFIEKSARDLGACGFAFYELAKTIKDEVIQEVVDDIKKAAKEGSKNATQN